MVVVGRGGVRARFRKKLPESDVFTPTPSLVCPFDLFMAPRNSVP